ncbi:MAG: DUF5018 domain-containing protein [Cyclobacteriaceae bacterium]
MPYQKQFNGAGIDAGEVLLDIDGEIRNRPAPDIGANEFSVDFGVTQLLDPDLSCDLSADQQIIVVLRQYGDLPFIDQEVAYQINGGTVVSEVIPGTIFNDIEHTFSTTADMSAIGTYNFKIWLVENQDENVNNDTLEITRNRNTVPVADFTFNNACGNEAINFMSTSTVASGSLVSYEWIFGDGDTSYVENPVKLYELSGDYTVEFRAYSDAGCYGSISKVVSLSTTPVADYSVENTCFGETTTFTNNSTIPSGTLTYSWDLGAGESISDLNTSKQYNAIGNYDVTLEVTSVETGCKDTQTQQVAVTGIPSITLESTKASDGVRDGTVTATVVGGTPDYELAWSNGISGNTAITGLQGGTYTLSVSDVNGCIASESIDVFQCVTALTTETITICAGESADIGGVTRTESGNFEEMFNAANGCDSIHTTTLVVIAPPRINEIFTSDTLPTISGASESNANLEITVGGAIYDVVANGAGWTLDLETATPTSGTLNLTYNTYLEVSASATGSGCTLADTSNLELYIEVLSAEARITGFDFSNQVGDESIEDTLVNVVMPFGTLLAALTPEIIVSDKATISPASGTSQDFSDSVVYTVTAEDGSIQQWIVKITIAANTDNSISSMSIEGVNGVVDNEANTVVVTLPFGTDVTSLEPTITLPEQASIDPFSGVIQDFSNPITYSVTAGDASVATWEASVVIAPNTDNSIQSLSINGVEGVINEAARIIRVALPYGADVDALIPTITLPEQASVSPQSDIEQNFTNSVTYIVTAGDGSTKSWSVYVDNQLNTEANIKSFSIAGEEGEIDSVLNTIDITLPYGSDITSLSASIVVSDQGSFSPTANGLDFSNPVVFTVTSGNGIDEDWTVNVTVAQNTAAGLNSFELLGVKAVINPNNFTVSLELPYKTDVTSLTPILEFSEEATVTPNPDSPQDFSSNVQYTITSQDGDSTAIYTVIVSVVQNDAADIESFEINGVTATISESTQRISLILPSGTDLTALTPVISISEDATISPAGDVERDFTSLVGYTVTAQDGSISEWVVSVTLDNNPPSDILLSGNTIREDANIGTFIGRLSAEDPDEGDTHSFELVESDSHFELVGDSLLLREGLDFDIQNAYEVEVLAKDQDGSTLTETFSIDVLDVNYAPTNLTLSATSIEENLAKGASIGVFGSEDADEGDSPTYSLTTSPGYQNAFFTITGNTLKSKVSFDFETQSSYLIEAQVRDASGAKMVSEFNIDIVNSNDAPTASKMIITAKEDELFTGELDGSDPDNDPLNYIILNAPDKGTLTHDESSAQFTYLADPDYFGIDYFSYTVFDGSIYGPTVGVNIRVENVNDAPTELLINGMTDGSIIISDSLAPGDLSILLSMEDIDNTQFEFALSEGEGDTDNALFEIADNQLTNLSTLDYIGLLSIRISASDGEFTLEKVVTIDLRVKVTQTISFDLPDILFLDESPYPLEATASSGLEVLFNSIEGNVVRNIKSLNFDEPGYITVKAYQEGNDTLAYAEKVDVVLIKRPYALSANIQRPDGSPLGQGIVKLFFEDGGLSAKSDVVQGLVEFTVEDGDYILQVVPTGSDDSDMFSTYWENAKQNKEADLLTLSGQTEITMTMLAKESKANAQSNGMVKGKVVKSEGNSGGRILIGGILDGVGVAEISVYLYRVGDTEIYTSAITDNDGYFAMRGVESGAYRLELDVIGLDLENGSATFNYDESEGSLDVSAAIAEDGSLSVQYEKLLYTDHQNMIEIFPNPTHGKVNMSGLLNIQSTSYELLDLNGQILTRAAFSGDHLSIDLTEYVNGVYFIRLNGGNQEVLLKVLKE